MSHHRGRCDAAHIAYLDKYVMFKRRRRPKFVLTLIILAALAIRVLFRLYHPVDTASDPAAAAASAADVTSVSTTFNDRSTNFRQRCSPDVPDDVILQANSDDDVDFRVELVYPVFIPQLPQFVADADRETFVSDPVNRRYLQPPDRRELVGKIKVIRDALIRVGRHECSWLADDGEFARPSYETGSNRTSENRNQNATSVTVCPLLVPDGHTFQHFVDGVMPKLVQLRGVLGDTPLSTDHCRRRHPNDDVEYILYRPRDRVIYEILERFGIGRRQLRLVPPPDDGGAGSLDISATRLIDTCVAPAVHPVLWRRARLLLVGSDRRPLDDRRKRGRKAHVIDSESNERRRLQVLSAGGNYVSGHFTFLSAVLR
jgi:hypothetical protein